jgi:hypothetical protein
MLKIFRFTFNAERGACERTAYGGCGGSENLFLSEADCVHACLPEGRKPDLIIFPARHAVHEFFSDKVLLA